ncbi:hypothetical protein JW926_14915 [Candidatus Sumerlaeota bacterium]|nr:hypothetical protein [Candidatus Sumerlaeota bacterium]
MNTNTSYSLFILLFLSLPFCDLVQDSAFGDDTDYGADAANAAFPSSIRRTDSPFNYLALRDHIGPSGVPLGGIGVGCFDIAPDGRFTRIALNNTHEDGVLKDVKGTFMAVWESGYPVARRLVRDKNIFLGMSGFEHTTYRGLFPTTRIAFDNGGNTRISLHAFSGCIPHNIKDSSLPVAFLEVTFVNTMGSDCEVSAALSWEDIFGRGIRDIKDDRTLSELKNDAWGMWGNGATWNEIWGDIERKPSFAEAFAMDGWKGIRQYTQGNFKPRKWSYQNYVSEVAILTESSRDAQVTFLPSYDVDQGDLSWESFVKTGLLSNMNQGGELFQSGSAKRKASAVAMKIKLKGAEMKTIRFLIAWHFPEPKIDREKDHPNSWFGSADYARYFHNFFPDFKSLLKYAINERERILDETQEWRKPVLESSFPNWLKFKLINSSYTLFTNTILNKAGDFTVMEGGMFGLAGTMDQRICAHPVYQKFFPLLNRSEMELFSCTQGEKGDILHFDANYYIGMASKDGKTPTPHSSMLDNTMGWIIQLAKDYRETGDLKYLETNLDRIRKGFVYLKSQIKVEIQIPVGDTTYDDYPHPPIYSYTAGMYLATLNAGKEIGSALNDPKMAKDCKEQFEKTRSDFIRRLWNGRFFSYGCEMDGTGRQDHRMFTGQIAGQFVSRLCHWGDVIPLDMARASLISQFKTSLASSPDFYANKVFDLNLMRGVDMPGSQCWPFYLESYTAMAALQAGYVDEGLDIMKNIQMVHLRSGWTWTQNLWNPGEMTYMTAPVTWFITDVIAGAGLDVNKGVLYLAPIVSRDADRIAYPIYYPGFWASLVCVVGNKDMKLRIIETFGDGKIIIRKIVCEPAGLPAENRSIIDIEPFVMERNAALDLSPYWDILIDSNL